MPFQKFIKLLMAHPRFGPQIINKIADSMPIRWAAKLTASMYLRGKHAIEQQLRDPKHYTKSSNPYNETTKQNFDVNRFKETLTKELHKEWEKAKTRPPKR